MSLLLAGGPLLLAWGPLLLWSCAWAACVPRTRGGLVLFLGALALLWRRNPRFGTLAFAMLLMRFVQGQFDLFWSSVVVSVPFVVVGVCLGAEAYAREHRPHGRSRAVFVPTFARLEIQTR